MAFLKRTAETGLVLFVVAGVFVAAHQVLRAFQLYGNALAPQAAVAQVGTSDRLTARQAVPVTLVADAAPSPAPVSTDKASAGGQILEEGLPDSTIEEREMFQKMLKDLPAKDQRELSRVRRERLHHIRRAALAYPPTSNQPPLLTTKDGSSNADLPQSLANSERLAAGDRTGSEAMIRETLAAIEEARQVILGNLANADTPGYKRRIVSLSTNHDGPPIANHDQIPKAEKTTSHVGLGVGLVPSLMDNSQGRLRRTGRRLDLAIEGPGYFQISRDDDPKMIYRYTRYGRFEINSKGFIVLRGMKHEWILRASVTVPPETTDIDIGIDGVIYVTKGNGGENPIQIGTIQLALFVPDSALPSDDDVALLDTDRGACVGNPGLYARGILKQGFYEESNVDPHQELAELQKLQRQARFLEEALRLIRGGDFGQD